MFQARFALLAAIAGILLAGIGSAHGQAAVPDRNGGKAHAQGAPANGRLHYDCSRAPNPANCEARRKEFRSQLVNAQNACENKHGEEHHACMIRTMCQQARDPRQCETIAQRRADHRREIREACAGRTGDELQSCVRNRIGYEERMDSPERERND